MAVRLDLCHFHNVDEPNVGHPINNFALLLRSPDQETKSSRVAAIRNLKSGNAIIRYPIRLAHIFVLLFISHKVINANWFCVIRFREFCLEFVCINLLQIFNGDLKCSSSDVA